MNFSTKNLQKISLDVVFHWGTNTTGCVYFSVKTNVYISVKTPYVVLI